jgi:hypothetical protein
MFSSSKERMELRSDLPQGTPAMLVVRKKLQEGIIDFGLCYKLFFHLPYQFYTVTKCFVHYGGLIVKGGQKERGNDSCSWLVKMANKPFVYPNGFDAVAGEFALYFNREQLKEFAEKFNIFDEDGDSFINFFELKRAQEKLGNPKTHTELTEMMQSMAADPKKGISFRDFVKVQAKLKGWKGDGGTDGPSYIPMVEQFAQSCNDLTVAGIKNFHEAKLKSQQAELEREQKIKQKLEERKKKAAELQEAKRRAEEERRKEEEAQKAAEEKRRQDRIAFQQRNRALFEQGSANK